ncbi:MAG: chemotaxis protein CheW [Gammaproteobacteria bacterium]|nr:chemotaxis protein CheW [Gammaproteobacteria bacterium]
MTITNVDIAEPSPQLSKLQSELLQYLVFKLGNEIYGINILKVQEIKGWTPVTAIPKSPDYIKGVLNLRGEIAPILDIRIRFSMNKFMYAATTVIIVITVNSEQRDRTIGLVVDGVWDVVDFSAEDIQNTPEFGSGVNTEFIEGLVNIDNCNVMLLDPDQLFSDQEHK